VFGSIGSIALSTPGNIRTTTKCRMSPLPTVLVLWNTWVYVGTFDSSDKMSNVKMMIDNVLHRRTALRIPNVHPDHHHVRFRRRFDDTSVITQGCGQTLGLGLGQSKDIVVVFY